MATIKPFPALRPKTELADRICELPYDVMSSAEARQMAEGNPNSFLHVSKPEIDLPKDTDPHSPEVYSKGRENLDQLIDKGALTQDSQPSFYLYRQIMGQHTQTGLVATASCQEYLDGVIKKHEFTRPEKEDDRVHHMEALDAQTGPVFLTYKAVAAIDDLGKRKTANQPAVDFTSKDGVQHSAWVLDQPEDIQFLETAFDQIESLYIADGHHRSAAAGRVFQTRSGAGQSGSFLTVIFPHDQMQILSYNRVLKDLKGHTPDQVIAELEKKCELTGIGLKQPTCKGEVCLYLEGKWMTLTFRSGLTADKAAVDALDVSLLQDHVLSSIFGIDDPRTSNRITFVGGIRGSAELEKLVNSGEYACAFSMFSTSIDDLMSVSDAGGVMPPKSTWFEPKLRDGMFSHMI